MPQGARDAEQQPRPKEEGAGERDPACDTKKRGRSCALTDMLSSKAAIVTRQNRQQHRPRERFDVHWPRAFEDTGRSNSARHLDLQGVIRAEGGSQ